MGERGERGLLEAGGGAVLGDSQQAPHMQGRNGGAPNTAGHRAPWHWALAARTCTRVQGCPQLTLVHTHSGWHQQGTAAGTQNVALGHTRCQRASERVCVQAPVPRVNVVEGHQAHTGLMGPLTDTGMTESVTGVLPLPVLPASSPCTAVAHFHPCPMEGTCSRAVQACLPLLGTHTYTGHHYTA